MRRLPRLTSMRGLHVVCPDCAALRHCLCRDLRSKTRARVTPHISRLRLAASLCQGEFYFFPFGHFPCELAVSHYGFCGPAVAPETAKALQRAYDAGLARAEKLCRGMLGPGDFEHADAIKAERERRSHEETGR